MPLLLFTPRRATPTPPLSTPRRFCEAASRHMSREAELMPRRRALSCADDADAAAAAADAERRERHAADAAAMSAAAIRR